MELLEWTTAYIDYLNSFKRDLLSKRVEQNKVICEYTGKGIVTYVVHTDLDASVLEQIKEGSFVLVCLNGKNNLKFLIDNWQSFVINQKLKVIFSNPNVNLQWTLLPYTHNRFADPASLKTGLKSLLESVPEV